MSTTPRLASALVLICALCSACAPLRLTPTALVGGHGQQSLGAVFFAEPAPELPTWPQPLPVLPERLPSLGGDARCGSDPGEQARAQCLRGGMELGLAED